MGLTFASQHLEDELGVILSPKTTKFTQRSCFKNKQKKTLLCLVCVLHRAIGKGSWVGWLFVSSLSGRIRHLKQGWPHSVLNAVTEVGCYGHSRRHLTWGQQIPKGGGHAHVQVWRLRTEKSKAQEKQQEPRHFWSHKSLRVHYWLQGAVK